jgi:hypothetical protein
MFEGGFQGYYSIRKQLTAQLFASKCQYFASIQSRYQVEGEATSAGRDGVGKKGKDLVRVENNYQLRRK